MRVFSLIAGGVKGGDSPSCANCLIAGYKPTPKKKRGRVADIADVMDERSKRNYVEYGTRNRRSAQVMIDEENRRY